MQRKVLVPGVALLAVLAAGCTGDSGAEDSAGDAKAGETTTANVAPGRYRTLREPCGAVDRGILRDMLPGVATLPEERQEQAYAGTAEVTYDTDRRVGCRWKADSPDSSHSLVVDFERVVSYDSGVSDDDRAKEVFARQETVADLPSPSESPEETESTGETGKTEVTQDAENAENGGGAASEDPSSSPATDDGASDAPPGGADDAATTPGSPAGTGPEAAEGLQPRTLPGLGEAAFLDDSIDRSGSTAQRRTVNVVFRTSNVIVTVRYAAQPALTTEAPDSKELQEKAQALARKLAEQFSD
ncbi:DUF3558 domain-containing protein [Streptomyces hypolithicus]